jgi:hypothetical protein
MVETVRDVRRCYHVWPVCEALTGSWIDRLLVRQATLESLRWLYESSLTLLFVRCDSEFR